MGGFDISDLLWPDVSQGRQAQNHAAVERVRRSPLFVINGTEITDATDRKIAVIGAVTGTGPSGRCISADATTKPFISSPSSVITGDRTVVLVCKSNTTSVTAVYYTSSSAGGVAYWVGQNGTAWTIGGVLSGSSNSANQTDQVVVAVKNGATHTLYIDGVQVASGTNSISDGTGSSFLSFGTNTGYDVWSSRGQLYVAALYDVALDETEIKSITRNPWQLFKKKDGIIWIPSASGGATITCAPGNATTAGITAGISSATTIACTPGGASTAGVACALPIKIACNVGNATPTGIACSLPVVVQCNAGTATTAGVTAGISLDTSITIACNAGNATAAGVAAGISLDTSITISCNVGTATTAGVTAGISSATTITCNAGTATTAGVSATFPQSLSCNVGNATTTGITAQVEIAGQIVIGCNAGTATTAGVSANISSAFVLTCNAGTATTLGATAYFPQSLQCSPGNAIAVGIDATFTVAGPTTIVCNVGNATASGISFSFGGTLVDAPNGSGPAIIRPQTNRPLNVGGIRI